jgi:hypothetical protein
MKALPTLLAASLLLAVGACPIGEFRDSIGTSCVVDEDVCGTDYVCFINDDADDNGLCAPVADYGACDEPTYPVGAGDVVSEDDAVRVESSSDVETLNGAVRVEGNLLIDDPRPVGTIDIGEDLCGLSGLQQVTGSLLISQTRLKTLDGLQGLSFVGAGIGVASNPELTDLMGLANLMRVRVPENSDSGVTVVIADNDNLDNDAIAEFRAALEDRPSIVIHACGNLRARQENDDNECADILDRILGR